METLHPASARRMTPNQRRISPGKTQSGALEDGFRGLRTQSQKALLQLRHRTIAEIFSKIPFELNGIPTLSTGMDSLKNCIK
jgi:hypothetical protein